MAISRRTLAAFALTALGAGGLWLAARLPEPAPTSARPRTVVAAPSPVAAPRTSAVVDPAPPPPIVHLPVDWSRLCRPQPWRDQGPVVVHRWRDADGVLHYGDAQPPSDARDVLTIAATVPPGAVVAVNALDLALPPLMQQQMAGDAEIVIALLASELGAALDRSVRLDALVVADAGAFARLRGEDAASVTQLGGFYDAAQRRIVVRRQSRDQDTRHVLRHEAAHAILHEAIGPLPTWLDEGLAEWFGHYDPDARQAAGAPERIALLHALSLDERVALLDHALAGKREEFDGADAPALYAASWALTAWMMREAPSRALLRSLVAAQRGSELCRPIDARHLIDETWPARLDGLLESVARWVDAGA